MTPHRLAIAATIALALVAATTAQAAQMGSPPSHPGQHGPAFTDHGIVQRNPRVVLVFWGDADAEVIRASQALFRRLGGSAYGGILAQYGVHDDAQLERTVIDNRPPSGPVTRPGVEAEVLRAQRAAGLADTFDTQWVVILPAQADLSHFGGECGEHGQFRSHHHDPWYVYDIILPYQAPGCGSTVGDMTASESHEFAEAATNPLQDGNKGWWIKVGPSNIEEIADICEWDLIQPWGPSGPMVQTLWSNASEGPHRDRGCVGRADGAAS